MAFKDNFKKNIELLGEFLTNPIVVKYCIYLIMVIFPTSILLGYIVAQFDLAGPGADLAGFNIIDNYISDMGSTRYTPIPKFLDNACMITAFLMIPCMLYIKKVVDSAKEEPGLRFRRFLSISTTITMSIGIIGLWGLGFFSEDVSVALESTVWPGFKVHPFFAFYLFPFIAISGFFIGLLFLTNRKLMNDLFKTNCPKIINILYCILTMVLTPLFAAFFMTNWLVSVIFLPSAQFHRSVSLALIPACWLSPCHSC